MRPTAPASPDRRWVWCAALVGAAWLATACNQLNNPFKDSTAYTREELTTPSANDYLARNEPAPGMARRNFPQSDVYHESGLVTHWPLWTEDPFEYKGNDATDPNDRDAPDNVFAWNGADFLHIAYGPGRFLLNLAGLPVSAVLQPPGMPMASDGRIGQWFGQYDYDSEYAKPGDEPPDYNDLHRTRYDARRAISAATPADAASGEAPPAAPASGEPVIVEPVYR